MSDIDDRYPKAFVQCPYLQLHVVTQLLIECSEWLIHQNQLRLGDQSASKRYSLLLATATTAARLRSPMFGSRTIARRRPLSLRCPLG